MLTAGPAETHATLDVTMDIYAHAALDEQREALRKLERRLSG